MPMVLVSSDYQHEPVRLRGWMVLQLPGRSYHIIGPSDFPHKYRLSSPLVLLNINEMLGITETGRRYDLTAPRLDPSSAVYQSVADYSGAPQVVIWSDSLFSTPQTLLPSLLHPSGPKQLQPALEAIEALRAAPETWAPKLADLLAMLDIDPQDHHRAVGLDEASWRLALSAQLNEVWPRVALHAWLIPEILTSLLLWRHTQMAERLAASEQCAYRYLQHTESFDHCRRYRGAVGTVPTPAY
jgi:hypothetical protein